MPTYLVTIAGDSFIRRLNDQPESREVLTRNHKITQFHFTSYLQDGRSLQSAHRFGAFSISTPPGTDLLVVQLGGNDLSSSFVQPAELANDLITAVNDCMTRNQIPKALVLPTLYRYERGLRHPKSVYRTMHPRERASHFNTRVDEFNSEIRRLVAAHPSHQRGFVRFGKLRGLQSEHCFVDGVHLKPVFMVKYAKLILNECIPLLKRQ